MPVAVVDPRVPIVADLLGPAIVVEHALTSATPRTRYLVGADAKLRARIGAFVPDRLRDRLFTRVLGLPARGSLEGAVR